MFVISSYIINIGQVVMGIALLAVTFGTRDRWRVPVPMIFLTAFFIVVALTFKSTEFRSYENQPLIDFFKVLLITFVGVSVLDTRPRIRFFMVFYLASFALFPVRGGIFNWFVYNAATQGRVAWNNLFENPNDYAALMLFPMGLCLSTLLAERNRLMKQAAFLGTLALPLLIFMTQSRGAILALGVAVMMYFLVQSKGRGRTLIGVAAIAVVVAVFAPRDVWDRLLNLRNATASGNLESANDSRSAEQRFEIWKVAWKVHQSFPITGVGWSAYPNAHFEFARRNGMAPLARGARDAHNTYLTLLGETGWIGFLLWFGFIGTLVTSALHAMRRLRPYAAVHAEQIKMLLLALLAYAAAGVFGSFAGVSFTYVHLAALMAITAVSHREADEYMYGNTGQRRRSS
jgi:O-antigen ligase